MPEKACIQFATCSSKARTAAVGPDDMPSPCPEGCLPLPMLLLRSTETVQSQQHMFATHLASSLPQEHVKGIPYEAVNSSTSSKGVTFSF